MRAGDVDGVARPAVAASTLAHCSARWVHVVMVMGMGMRMLCETIGHAITDVDWS